jgi:hypothetical protein
MSIDTIYNLVSKSQDHGLFVIARIARLSIRNPAFVLDVLDGLRSKDTRIAMFCADAIEKISRTHATLLTGYETEILTHLAVATWAEVRAPLARVVPRLTLDSAMKKRAIEVLFEYLKDDSWVLKDRVYGALAEVGKTDPAIAERMRPALEERIEASDLGERVRARKLLAVLTTPLTAVSSKPD